MMICLQNKSEVKSEDAAFDHDGILWTTGQLIFVRLVWFWLSFVCNTLFPATKAALPESVSIRLSNGLLMRANGTGYDKLWWNGVDLETTTTTTSKKTFGEKKKPRRFIKKNTLYGRRQNVTQHWSRSSSSIIAMSRRDVDVVLLWKNRSEFFVRHNSK